MKEELVNNKLKVLEFEISTKLINENDYISLTDLARYADKKETHLIISNWMRNNSTIEFLGLWEKMNNNNFKPVEFDWFRNKSGSNAFKLSPQSWIKSTKAIGIISKSGRYGGTLAHIDIALEFASWISPEFKLYVMTEFRRLKKIESIDKNWDIKRLLTKINYTIHAIKNNLIPKLVTKKQKDMIYAVEADLINVAELVCLVNLENLNSVYINEGFNQKTRLIKLNNIAIHQMKLLIKDNRVEQFKEKSEIKQ